MNENTINSIGVSNCTGCMLCAYVCPTCAISQRLDENGFRIPEIDINKCIECGMCLKNCPAVTEMNPISKNTECYAAMSDDNTRLASSSGGAFATIARYVLQAGGVVVGAAYKNDFEVEHELITDITGLIALQKSKYVQSNIYNVYSEIEKYIQKGTIVLFAGTPCQCAAVKKLYGDYKNLILLDILCMGVASEHCFKKYINEEFDVDTLKEIDFRYKEKGHWDQQLKMHVMIGDREKVIPFKESSYFYLFLKGVSTRLCCRECIYAGHTRVGDITLGDFWGIECYKKTLSDQKGTSLLTINTLKGREVLNQVKEDFSVCEQVPFDVACKGNVTLMKNGTVNPKSNRFWEMYNDISLKENMERLFDETADCGIINYWYTNDHGAILTAFALQQLLMQEGYTSKLINLCPNNYNRNKGISQEFELKYLNSTYERYHEGNIKTLNGKYKYFLVGSDQVFRAEWVSDDWFLEFVDDGAYKIAISASFGTDKINASKQRARKIRVLLNRFNNISVREESAVNICRELGVESAEWILDPVFIVKKDVYENIAQNDIEGKKFCFCYIRDNNEEIKKQIHCYALKNQLEIVYCTENLPVEKFLGNIKNSHVLFTDSYHGLCFGLIFNKNMFCYVNQKRGSTRFDSLSTKLNIPEELFVRDVNKDLSKRKDIDYSEINSRLEIEREKSLKWIVGSLENPGKVNEFKLNVYKIILASPLVKIGHYVARIKRKLYCIVKGDK